MSDELPFKMQVVRALRQRGVEARRWHMEQIEALRDLGRTVQEIVDILTDERVVCSKS